MDLRGRKGLGIHHRRQLTLGIGYFTVPPSHLYLIRNAVSISTFS
jgi:hypothetical protein